MVSMIQIQELVQIAPGPHFCSDKAGYCTGTNASLLELTGLSAEASLGVGWTNALHPDDVASTAAAWRAQVDDGASFDAEFRFVNAKTGAVCWVRAKASAIRNDAGNVVGYCGQCIDVTDLHEARRAAEERTRLLEMGEAMMSVGHWHVFAKTNTLFWSDEVHRIHGTDPATFRPCLEDGVSAYHPDDRERIAALVAEAMGSRAPFTFEGRLIRTDGEVRIVRSAGIALDADGPDVIGVFQDVTEHRQLSERVARSEERYALAVSASQDGMWDWDPQARTLWWSDRFMAIVGARPQEFGVGLEEFEKRLYPEDRHEVLGALGAFEPGTAPRVLRYRLRHEDGHWVWIRATMLAVLGDDGAPVRVVGTASDVTAEVEAKAALEAKTAELVRSNAELDRFAAVASHDMKEPLRKIRAFCDRIVDRGLVEDARTIDYLDRIRRSADRMYAMVHDLLEIARVPAASDERKPVPLEDIVVRVLDSLSTVIEDAGCQVEIEALPAVLANDVQMQQVLHNLVENAIKYRATDRPPNIQIRSGPTDDAGRVRVEVVDNGIGFEQEFAERIFVLFERLHDRTSYSGTGLGLALCKRIIEQHHGSIQAFGAPEQGARFVFELPAAAMGEPDVIC